MVRIFNRKLEERKEYFEPQILKIEDDYEPVLSESELADNYSDDYVTYKAPEKKFPSIISDSSNIVAKIKNPKVPLVAKSTFKQSFDYEANAETAGSALDISGQNPTNENKSNKERRRSSSRDKSRRRSSSRKSTNDDVSSSSSSRAATGDTGYASSLSFSSETNVDGSVTSLRDRIRDSQYQAKIVISSSSSSSSVSQPTLVKQISQTSLNSKNSLKQLKSTLMPNSGLKLPRN